MKATARRQSFYRAKSRPFVSSRKYSSKLLLATALCLLTPALVDSSQAPQVVQRTTVSSSGHHNGRPRSNVLTNGWAGVTITFVGNGAGQVTITPPGFTCLSNERECTAQIAQGSEVTLSYRTSLPGLQGRFDFAGWGGDCHDAGLRTCNLIVDEDASVEARFQNLEPWVVSFYAEAGSVVPNQPVTFLIDVEDENNWPLQCFLVPGNGSSPIHLGNCPVTYQYTFTEVGKYLVKLVVSDGLDSAAAQTTVDVR